MNCRRLSQQRKIMVGERGRPNGLWLSAHYMASNPLLNHQHYSMTRAIGSCPRLLNKQRGEPKLQGTMNRERMLTWTACILFLLYCHVYTHASIYRKENYLVCGVLSKWRIGKVIWWVAFLIEVKKKINLLPLILRKFYYLLRGKKSLMRGKK